MTRVLPLHKLEDTILWKRFAESPGFTKVASQIPLVRLLPSICQEASNRMRLFSSLHSQYTLHDEIHLLRVTELMGRIIPDEVHEKLEPVELILLVLSAYFHDQGMVLEKTEIEAIESSSEYRLFCENWKVEHPNAQEIEKRLPERGLSNEERSVLTEKWNDLHRAMFTEYVRRTHGSRSAEFVKRVYADDDRWAVSGRNVADLVARLCESHVQPAEYLSPQNGFHYDEEIGTRKANMVFLALVLRLADVLDFDRDRAPDALFRTIHFTNEISRAEWEKHRAVNGWTIEKNLVRFTMEFEHPVYEKTARFFMDSIDQELVAAQALQASFPASISYLRLNLPPAVDRSRIRAKNGCYFYRDLEFSLSRDEIIKLLMTEQLYSSVSLCIRELLQNSLDALRHRRAIIKRDLGVDWPEGSVRFEHCIDNNGFEVLVCEDNGIGMNQDTVERFLTRVGRSYYRSPEFEQERLSFESSDCDFDPIARFGIGFMSVFMLGDHIVIQTRRENGWHKPPGTPLVIEVNGLGGMVVMRPGSPEQKVGTRIEIRSRSKPQYIDPETDKLRLVETVRRLSVASEFKVEASCTIEDIKGQISIDPSPLAVKTFLEDSELTQYVTFEQPFSDIDKRLRGSIKCSFLADEHGRPTLSNKEAKYEKTFTQDGVFWDIYKEAKELSIPWGVSLLSCDGIYVCGSRGFGYERKSMLQQAPIHLCNESFVLDVRGEIKPFLMPSRKPPKNYDRTGMDPQEASWKRIDILINRARGKIWEQVAESTLHSPEVFWILQDIYNFDPLWMSNSAIWRTIKFPFKRGLAGDEAFLALDEVKHFDGSPLETKIQNAVHHLHKLDELMSKMIISQSIAKVQHGQVSFLPTFPENGEATPAESILYSDYGVYPPDEIYVIPFAEKTNEFIFIDGLTDLANKNHPLTRIALSAQINKNKRDRNELEKFALAFFTEMRHFNDTLSRGKFDDSGLRLLAKRFLNVNWTQTDERLKPPYQLWLRDIGSTTINEDAFGEWTKIPVKPWDRPSVDDD